MANAETEDDEAASFNRGAGKPQLARNNSKKLIFNCENAAFVANTGGVVENDGVSTLKQNLPKNGSASVKTSTYPTYN